MDELLIRHDHSMKAKYNDKIVEAIRYNGFNKDEIKKFVQKTIPNEVYTTGDNTLLVLTEYTDIVVPQSTYVIRQEDGRIYLCNPDDFNKEYDILFEYTWDANLFKMDVEDE